jgi:hypothetical protein
MCREVFWIVLRSALRMPDTQLHRFAVLLRTERSAHSPQVAYLPRYQSHAKVEVRPEAFSGQTKRRGRFSSPIRRQAVVNPNLVEPEVNFDVDLHRHRAAILHRRLEFPPAHGLERFLIQAHAEAAGYFDVPGIAVLIHDEP